MLKAMKLSENNFAQLREFVSEAVYNDYKMEFELNTEDGDESYATMQDYINSNGRVLVHVYDEATFRQTFTFTEPESDTEFKDITTTHTAKR